MDLEQAIEILEMHRNWIIFGGVITKSAKEKVPAAIYTIVNHYKKERNG